MAKPSETKGTTLTIPLATVIPADFPLGKNHVRDTYKDPKIYETLIEVRAMLLKNYPFWGTWVVNLVFVEDPTGIIGTFCTDGKHIFYSAEFVKYIMDHSKTGNPRHELLFIIAHEIFHCLGRHIAQNGWYRGKGLDIEGDPIDPKKFNAAADFFINNDLEEAKTGVFPKTVGGLLEPKFKGMTVEEIYLYLKHNPDECPSGGGFDTHVEVKIGAAGQEPTLTRNEDGSITLTVSPEDMAKMEERMHRVTHQANTAQAQHDQITKSAGSLPAGILRMIDELIKPKVNWRAALRRYVRTVKMRGYSMMNPNRSFFQGGISIPGFRKTREQIDMVVMIDASGSIGPTELLAFASEMKGILDSMPDFKVMAWTFDGEVQEESVTMITRRGTNTMDALIPFLKNLRGGGGTSFASNWEYMKRNKIKPRIAVMFTDGYTYDGWGDPTHCPMMWLVTGNGESKPGYGTYVKYELDQ